MVWALDVTRSWALVGVSVQEMGEWVGGAYLGPVHGGYPCWASPTPCRGCSVPRMPFAERSWCWYGSWMLVTWRWRRVKRAGSSPLVTWQAPTSFDEGGAGPRVCVRMASWRPLLWD